MNSPSGEEDGVSFRRLCPTLLEDHPRLESILGCSICYDTIRDPILTKCSHSFCSLCIRRYMLIKQQCPACFSELHENDLIPNKPLAETVVLFTQSSPSSARPSSTDCNVCGISVLRSKFEAHSLHCSLDSPVKPLSSNSMKFISKPVYHLLKDSELRKKLKEEGLGIKGDRKALISRHQQFVVLWNTERSKENPLSKIEILALLQKEEETKDSESKKRGAPSLLSTFNRNSDPKVIEQKQKEILSANKSVFDELMDNVRREQGKEASKSPSSEKSPSLTQQNGELYVTPKRKVFLEKSLTDSGKKMKQHSVRSLFEKTEKRKVSCPSCNALITASFLNIHLDRCLEVEAKVTRPRRRKTSQEEDEDFIPFSTQK